MKKICLSELEVQICKSIALQRRKADRDAGIDEKYLGPGDGEHRDIQGVCAEFAIAKLMNLYPDFTTNPRRGGKDLTDKNGKRIDVKQTDKENGNLIAPFHKSVNEVDIYVLVIGTNPYQVVGWCKSAELIRDENIKDFGYGKTYFMHRDKLRKF
jgi:hypothetical protein